MSTSLQNIITEIKTVALANGFTSVDELKLNLQKVADTELPKLFIKVAGIDYEKFQYNSAVELYKMELIFVLADGVNPITDIKTLMDGLLNKLFNDNILFSRLAKGGKITIIDCDLSNDRDTYSKLGGVSAVLSINISNINKFGGVNCL